MVDFWWLIFACWIGDWSLQSRWMAEQKAKHWIVMLSHCIVWTGCVCIALEYIDKMAWWKPWFLIIGHYLVDVLKARSYKTEKDMWMVYVDHILHILQLLIVYCY